MAKTLLVMALVAMILTSQVHAVYKGAATDDSVMMAETQTNKAADEFKKSRFGAMLTSFMEFGVAPKDARALYDAFDLIIAAVKKMIDEENAQYSKVSNDLRKFRGTLEDSLSDITRGINVNQQLLDEDLKPSLKRLEGEISRTQSDISTVSKQIDELEKQQKEANDDTAGQTKNLNDLINAIDRALEILQNLQAGEKGSSLLQTNVKSFRQVMLDIKDQLPSLKGYPAKPLVEALVDMTAHGDLENREAVQKVMRLLNNVRSQLTSQLNDLQKAASDSTAAFKKSQAAQKALKATYEKKLSQAQKDYDRTSGQSKVIEGNLNELKGTQDNLSKNLKETDGTIQKVNELHGKQIDGLTKELELVERALRELDRNGISRPPK